MMNQPKNQQVLDGIEIRKFNIWEALEFYRIIKDSIPETNEENDVEEEFLNFVIAISKNVLRDGVLLDCLVMFTGKLVEELEQIEVDYMDIFIRGLTENEVLKMKYFFGAVGAL